MKHLFLFLFTFTILKTTKANSLPPPSLVGQDQQLVGEWVHLSSYCENWNADVTTAYKQKLRDKKYVEHLFINLWDMKLMQSDLDPQTPKLPYDFCERDIYFKPISWGGVVKLEAMDVSANHCLPISVFNDTPSQVILNYRLYKAYKKTYMKALYYNWPGCDGSALMANYRKR